MWIISDYVKDLTGLKFHKLRVILFAGTNRHRKAKWFCECDCGNDCIVVGGNLTSATTLSCGCHHKKKSTVHGLSYSVEYRAYYNMLNRCYNKKHEHFKYYGALGVTVCDRWLKSFKYFFEDIGYRPTEFHSVDRINPNGNYEPSNCRWATAVQQNNNKRKSICG